MKIFQHTTLLCSLVLIVLIAGFTACTSMHDPYEDFIKDGEIVYPGKADSVLVYPGFNRLQLTWPLPADPTIAKARIYWQNKRDSVEVWIDSVRVGDQARVTLEDMDEGTYSFSIHHYDTEGNASVEVTVSGRVFGETYTSSLLPRIIDEALFVDDTLRIEWGSGDETAFANEVSYTSLSGDKRIYVPGDEELTIVDDFDFSAGNTFKYRTMHRPDSMSIDTFYTALQETRVLGPRVEVDKSGWTVTDFSSEDAYKSNRYARYTIDGDESTVWVNELPPGTQTDYPHWLIVDMGSEIKDIYGMSFVFQGNNTTPRTIEIRVSSDGINWEPIGIFNTSQTSAKQLIDFSSGHTFRHFEFKALEAHGNTQNIIVKEIGVYTR